MFAEDVKASMRNRIRRFASSDESIRSLLVLWVLEFFSFFIIVVLLILSCVEVNLFTMGIIFSCLFYFGNSDGRLGLIYTMLIWTSLFVLTEYVFTMNNELMFGNLL